MWIVPLMLIWSPLATPSKMTAPPPEIVSLSVPLLNKEFVKEPPAIPQDCGDFAFLATAADPTDSLLIAADAMVTDYSSVVFEYSLLGRLMAFFAYDLDDYNDWRGFYYDYDQMTPGPVVRTTAELADYLANAGTFDRAQVDAFRDKFMSACDGHATERICHFLGMR